MYNYYKIRKGDTIYNIAKLYNIDYKLLAYINGLDIDDYIYEDQVIAVPTSNDSYYITKEGDTINNICSKLNICNNINYIDNLLLEPNQIIIKKLN